MPAPIDRKIEACVAVKLGACVRVPEKLSLDRANKHVDSETYDRVFIQHFEIRLKY